MKLVGPLLLQVVLIFLNAVFAMAEIAVISISDAKLSRLEEEGNKKAGRLLRLKGDPAKFLATIQVAITLAGFLGSAFAADNFSDYFIGFFARLFPQASLAFLDGLSVILITLILSYLSLVFGELVPKRVAMRKAEKVALGLSGTVYSVSRIFAPVVWFLTLSTNAVLRLLGIDPNAAEEEYGEEDIRMMAASSAEQGSIEEEERELIENIFEFDDLTVGEITTHRTDVALLWMEEDESAWEETIRSSRYTLYPICEGSIDHIVGILDTKDYFRMQDKSREKVLEKAVKTPYFVPEGAKADVTFRNMQKNRVSFAVVLDEYAGFSGIISIKDLIERIVGDMIDADEEQTEKEDLIQAIEENKWRIRGNVSLSVLSKVIGIEFPDDYETVSGLVFSLYGSVPEDGSEFEVEWENMVLSVQEVREHQVVSAVLTLIPNAPEEEE